MLRPPTSPARRGTLALVALVVGAAVLTAGCSAGGDGTPVTTVPPIPTTPATDPSIGTTPPGTSSAPGTATITRFDAPAQVPCTSGATASIKVTYETDAASVGFLLDGTSVPGTGEGSGSRLIDLPCDGAVHTLVLAAIDADGHSTVQSKAVLLDDGR